MTLQQLLPSPHLLPTCLQPKNTPQHAFLDWWVDHYVEIDTRVKTRLTGGGSLYQAYVDACLEESLIPLSLRAFTKRFETLLEFKLNIPSTKARDQKGTFFRAIKLKDACHHITPVTLSSLCLQSEKVKKKMSRVE